MFILFCLHFICLYRCRLWTKGWSWTITSYDCRRPWKEKCRRIFKNSLEKNISRLRFYNQFSKWNTINKYLGALLKLSFKIYGVIFQYEWIIFKIFLVFLSGFRVWRGRVVSINHQCHIIWLRRIQLKFLHLEELLEQLGHRIQLFVNLAHLKFKIKRLFSVEWNFQFNFSNKYTWFSNL